MYMYGPIIFTSNNVPNSITPHELQNWWFWSSEVENEAKETAEDAKEAQDDDTTHDLDGFRIHAIYQYCQKKLQKSNVFMIKYEQKIILKLDLNF